MVVDGGKVIGVDMPKLASTARDAIAHLDEVNRGARDFVEALEPVVIDYCVGLASQPYHVQRWCGDAHQH